MGRLRLRCDSLTGNLLIKEGSVVLAIAAALAVAEAVSEQACSRAFAADEKFPRDNGGAITLRLDLSLERNIELGDRQPCQPPHNFGADELERVPQRVIDLAVHADLLLAPIAHIATESRAAPEVIALNLGPAVAKRIALDHRRRFAITDIEHKAQDAM